MSIPDTSSHILIYIYKGQKIKTNVNWENLVVKKRNKKGDEKKAEEEERMNREKKLKSDTRVRRDTIENKVRVKSKKVRGMSR